MSDWSEVSLGDVFEFRNGKSIRPGTVGTYPVFGSNGVIGGTNSPHYDEGIVIGRVGAYCGSVVHSSDPFWASDNTIVALPQRSLRLRFGFYLLESLKLNRWAGGAAQPLLTQTVLKDVPTRVPRLDTQDRITAVLAAYDELIENNLRRIEILEEMAQAVYREWFVNFRFLGHEDATLVDSVFGPIPAGWAASKFGDVAAEIREGVDPTEVDPDTRYVGLEHIPQKSFTLVDSGLATDVTSRKWRFEAGDVLFGKLRPYFHKVVEAGFPGICSTDAIVIRAG